MEILRQLFSELVISHHNMRMLHWNVTGRHFDSYHKVFDEYTTKLNTFIDELGEIMKMLSIEPMDMIECITLTQNSNDDIIYIKTGVSFNEHVAYDWCNKIFASLQDTYTRVYDEYLPSDIKGKLDSHLYFFRSELNYKGNARTV